MLTPATEPREYIPDCISTKETDYVVVRGRPVTMCPSPLPEELWRQILGHLRKPLPVPLSRTPRADLRQADLCAASRVCRVSYFVRMRDGMRTHLATLYRTLADYQLFDQICRPLLYRYLITDDIPTLLTHVLTPSMQKRFAYTRRMY